TSLQVIINRLWMGKWDHKQLITLAVFLLFGGMTLYFHNPIFVKWKPTIIFWIFGVVIVSYQLFTKKSLIQRLMQNVLQDKGEVPIKIWKRLDIIWAVFFSGLGAVNLYIAYSFSNNVWVNFKFYGITGALLLFSFFQACYLMQHLTEVNKNDR
ncbi:MAG: septation protein A, partial [Gammaproteobacteria bacterium]